MNTTSLRGASRASLHRAASVLAFAALLSSLITPHTFAAAPTKPAEKPADARVAIGPETTPGDNDSLFKITLPGSYYLTANVVGVAGKSGIEIGCSDVTLDLNGFVLAGNPLALDGVRVDAPSAIENVTIRNGSATGWGRHGVSLARHYTVETYAQSSVIENVQAARNLGSGIRTGTNSTVQGCTATFNGDAGISADLNSVIEGSAAMGNGSTGISIAHGSARGCSASNNGSYGFLITASTAVDCAASYNDGAGFFAGNRSLVKNCTSWENTWGFHANGGTIQGCSAHDNTLGGISSNNGASVLGNTVGGTRPAGGSRPGIVVYGSNGLVADNKVSSANLGIHVFSGSGNRIEANNMTDNDIGLKVDGAMNIIVRNTARNSQKNYQVIGGNRAGAFVAPALSGAVDGSTGGNGSGTTDPFANLSF